MNVVPSLASASKATAVKQQRAPVLNFYDNPHDSLHDMELTLDDFEIYALNRVKVRPNQ